MAQMSNPNSAADSVQKTLSVNANDQPVTVDLSRSLSPNTPEVVALSPKDIIDILLALEHSPQNIKEAISAVETKGDVFAVKKYLDDHRDPLSELQESIDSFTSGHGMFDKGGKFENEQKQANIVEVEDAKEDVVADKFPVHVFVRVRPLIQSEIERNDGQIVTETKYVAKTKSATFRIEDSTARNVRKSAIRRPGRGGAAKGKAERKKIKTFKGFGDVLSADIDNEETFRRCVFPSICNIWKGRTVCSFAYGHTGSGKTYTIMGYDKDESPGMYRLTAEHIESELKSLNSMIDDKTDEILMSCRFAELYQGKMRDLFGGLVECHVREGDDGRIVIRGPTLKDEVTGQVKVAPLTPVYVRHGELDKFLDRVTASLALRKQGSSAVHDESSRSHVFLEMELVTKRVIAARAALWNAEAEIVPIGKEMTDQRIANSPFVTGAIVHDKETNKWSVNAEWKEDESTRKRMALLEKEWVVLSVKIKGCQQRLEREIAASHCCVGGKVVFVDLAGNEWGGDSKSIRNDNAVQLKERQEINKSLMALKECVRAMNDQRDHVPYRNSKLTMVLRPHLKAQSSKAIMIANISPSDQHIKKTFNTLSYSALVAKA